MVDDLPMSDQMRATVYSDLLRMAELCRARGVRYAVLAIGMEAPFRRAIRDVARDGGVPAKELLSLFPEAHGRADLAAKFGLGWDPHYGADAHRRWGGALVALLEQHGLLPPR